MTMASTVSRDGCFKLNTDASVSKLIGSSEPEENNMLMESKGSFKLETGYDDDKWKKPKYGYKASAGGLIRDHTGEWMVGFTARLELCDIISAELQAKVIIESDSEQAVNLIKNPKWNSENHPLGCIIESDWELFHICREKNMCADAMANKAKNQMKPLKIWEETPPGRVHDLVSADMYDYVVY
ncbi:hypothetical protein ACJIZ3_008973 [Penstemon smallii]|uniref:RNase H type-1 domain-containing protein n=1 Tax=Penstemon smallii TaxID=265156 RepID=A0ABD3TBQ1_9LAMI